MEGNAIMPTGTKVYMVHAESGEYSDWTYDVKGVFSSREKAVAYIESLSFPVVWDDDMSYCCIRHYEDDEECYDHSGIATLVTHDGMTWQPMCDGMPVHVNFGDELTYYVTEYEVDARCRDI